MTRWYLGIDPGLSGAFAFYEPEQNALIRFDMPTHTVEKNGKARREPDALGLYTSIDLTLDVLPRGTIVVIERVGPMPTDGARQAFNFGRTYGTILGVLAGFKLRTEFVTPQTWKKKLNVPAEKDGSRARASQLLPAHAGHWQRVKDDGRAEAAMIAFYGSQVFL